MASRRKSLNESENLQSEPIDTPEMVAFRKGDVVPLQNTQQTQVQPSKVEDATTLSVKEKNKKLVVELEPDLYEAFATVCFKQKMKMAKVVRQWIEDYVQAN